MDAGCAGWEMRVRAVHSLTSEKNTLLASRNSNVPAVTRRIKTPSAQVVVRLLFHPLPHQHHYLSLSHKTSLNAPFQSFASIRSLSK